MMMGPFSDAEKAAFLEAYKAAGLEEREQMLQKWGLSPNQARAMARKSGIPVQSKPAASTNGDRARRTLGQMTDADKAGFVAEFKAANPMERGARLAVITKWRLERTAAYKIARAAGVPLRATAPRGPRAAEGKPTLPVRSSTNQPYPEAFKRKLLAGFKAAGAVPGGRRAFAKTSGVSEQTLYIWARQAGIPVRDVSGKGRLPVAPRVKKLVGARAAAALERYVEPPPPEKKPRAPRAPAPDVAAVHEQLAQLQLENTVLKAMVKLAIQKGILD